MVCKISRDFTSFLNDFLNFEKNTLLLGDQQQNPLQDPKFYKFISKAVPMLEAELDAAKRSRAFDGYQLLESEMDAQVL